MKIIKGVAGSGKTKELIELASKGKYKLIVCHSHSEAFRIRGIAGQMKLKIPLPITYDEFINRQYASNGNVEALLIDNVEMLLKHISLIKIEAITINII